VGALMRAVVNIIKTTNIIFFS